MRPWPDNVILRHTDDDDADADDLKKNNLCVYVQFV